MGNAASNDSDATSDDETKEVLTFLDSVEIPSIPEEIPKQKRPLLPLPSNYLFQAANMKVAQDYFMQDSADGISFGNGCYKRVHTTGNGNSVFKCQKHDGCTHQVRVSTRRGDSMFTVFEEGAHTLTIKEGFMEQYHKNRAQAIFDGELQRLMVGSQLTPLLIHLGLHQFGQKIGYDKDMVNRFIPTQRSIANKIAYNRKRELENQATNRNAELNVYLLERNSTKQEFDSIVKFDEDLPITILRTYAAAQPHKRKVDATPVPDVVTSLPSETQPSTPIHGFAWTSKFCVMRLKQSLIDSCYKLALNVDGTFKLLKNGWVLIILGTTQVYRDRDGFVCRCIPAIFGVCKTESCAGFQMVMNSMKYVIQEFLEVDINTVTFVCGSCDHATYIMNAYRLCFLLIRIVDCFFHVKHGVRKTLTGKHDDPNNRRFKVLVNYLNRAKNIEVFRIMAKAMEVECTANGKQTAFASFKKTYLTELWGEFHLDAPGTPYSTA